MTSELLKIRVPYFQWACILQEHIEKDAWHLKKSFVPIYTAVIETSLTAFLSETFRF